MSDPKFTKGPWRTHPDVDLEIDHCPWMHEIDRYPKGGIATSQPVMAGGETVALTVWEGFDDTIGEANAALISAAPEMFEVLSRIFPRLPIPEDEFDHSVSAQVWRSAKAALLKANPA